MNLVVEINTSSLRKRQILQSDAIDIQHIGSTSIRSICAKPIIGIVVGVSSFDRIMKHNDELLANGFVYRGQDQPGQRLYVCGDLENILQNAALRRKNNLEGK